MPGQLDRFRKWVAEGTYRPLPAMQHLGIRLKDVDEGRAVFELATERQHMGPVSVHGGVLCTIADVAMATAVVTTLEVGEATTTVDLKISFMRPAPEGATITANSRVIKPGRSISFVECYLTDSAGQIIAHATSTCMTIRPTRTVER